MQGRHVGILVAIVLPLALVGCNKDQPQTAPTPVPAPPAGKAGTSINVPVEELSSDYEIHTSVDSSSQITWTDPSNAFYVEFKADNDPCVPSTLVDKKYHYYNSTTVAPYIATCTIANPPTGTAPYRYDIQQGQYQLDKPKKKHDFVSGHCQGCALDQ